MLRRLIDMLKNREAVTVGGLASELNESEEMVRVLLKELEKQGMIKSYASCGDKCEGCPVKASCDPKAEKVYFIR